MRPGLGLGISLETKGLFPPTQRIHLLGSHLQLAECSIRNGDTNVLHVVTVLTKNGNFFTKFVKPDQESSSRC
jgi:hypothetical protein